MGRITAEARKEYFDRMTEYKSIITQMQARERSLSELLAADDSGASYKRLTLADETLNIYSYYVLLNTLSVAMLNLKNDDMLAEARKTLYRAMKYMEDVVTPYIDVPYSDYEKNLESIESFDPEKRYALLRKFGFAIKQLEDSYGDNSKWKWAFVEIWAKYATIAKNSLELKKINELMDLDSPYRDVTHYHLQLVKKLFKEAADRYREKYELVTNKIDDFKVALTYLSALRRINVLLGEKEEVENLKKKIDIWNVKMETDYRRQDEKNKKR